VPPSATPTIKTLQDQHESQRAFAYKVIEGIKLKQDQK